MELVITLSNIAALSWCAWLVFDCYRECRNIDRGARGARALPTVGADHRAVRLSDCLEVR